MIYVKRKEFFYKLWIRKNTSEKENKKDKKSLIIIILLLLIIGLISYFGFFAKSDTDDTLAVDQTQSEYVKPEDPVDRSKNVSLPGWGSFTIPANTKKSTKDLNSITQIQTSGMKTVSSILTSTHREPCGVVISYIAT